MRKYVRIKLAKLLLCKWQILKLFCDLNIYQPIHKKGVLKFDLIDYINWICNFFTYVHILLHKKISKKRAFFKLKQINSIF